MQLIAYPIAAAAIEASTTAKELHADAKAAPINRLRHTASATDNGQQ